MVDSVEFFFHFFSYKHPMKCFFSLSTVYKQAILKQFIEF